MTTFTTLSYDVRDAKAYLTLNRPDRLNAIDDTMPSEIRAAVEQANAADDAKIGSPPARVWGCPTTAMWVYRLGAERAKRLLLTGDTIDGSTAAAWGLAIESAPADELDAAVERLADRIAGVPTNQLVMQK